jgi:hypothetical protein
MVEIEGLRLRHIHNSWLNHLRRHRLLGCSLGQAELILGPQILL